MRVEIFGETVELVPHDQMADPIDLSLYVEVPFSDIKEIWHDLETQERLVSRLLRFAKVNRSIDSLPQLPDEIAQNLRSDLLTHPDQYQMERDEVDEVEQLLQDFLRPIIYAVIQAHYQPVKEKPDFAAIIATLHAETAWRAAPPHIVELSGKELALSPIYTLAGPIGYELVSDGDEPLYIEDRSCQHPTIPMIEKLAVQLGEKLSLFI